MKFKWLLLTLFMATPPAWAQASAQEYYEGEQEAVFELDVPQESPYSYEDPTAPVSPEAEVEVPVREEFPVHEESPVREEYTAPRSATATVSNGLCTHGTTEAKATCRKLNSLRARQGLRSLKSDSYLTRLAQDYAQDLYGAGRLTHGDFAGRMRQAGVRGTTAENIGQGTSSPDQILRMWAQSPGHHQNMMGPSFTKIGIGYYGGFWVQIFSAR